MMVAAATVFRMSADQKRRLVGDGGRMARRLTAERKQLQTIASSTQPAVEGEVPHIKSRTLREAKAVEHGAFLMEVSWPGRDCGGTTRDTLITASAGSIQPKRLPWPAKRMSLIP